MGYGVATNNPFDLLGDENEAPEVAAARASAAAQEKVAAAAALEKKAAEAKADKPGKISSGGRGGNQARGRGDGRGGRGNDRGGRGYDRSAREDAGEEVQDSGSFRGAGRGGRGGRGGDRSGRGGRGYGGDGEDSRPRRRDFDRRSGTGRGVGDMKRGGAGKGNWGSNNEAPGSEAKPDDKVDGEVVVEKEDGVEQVEESATVPIVAEEDNEMTLEEYQKAAEEKKAAFKAQFGSGGKAKKAALDKELEKLAVVEKKPENPVFFVGATEDGVSKSKTKEKKEKETLETGFIIPHEAPARGYGDRPGGRGEGGRGRGRGRGDARGRAGRGEGRSYGGRGSGRAFNAPLTDDSAFPSLSA